MEHVFAPTFASQISAKYLVNGFLNVQDCKGVKRNSGVSRAAAAAAAAVIVVCFIAAVHLT